MIQRPTATPDPDRLFWLAIRAALLAMVAAIEQRHGLGKYGRCEQVIISKSDTVASAANYAVREP